MIGGMARIARGTQAACVLVLVGCLVAACGGASNHKPTSAGTASLSTQYRDAVKYAHCMRAHGISNFPDPRNPGGFSQAALSAVNVAAPAYGPALNVCQRLLPNAGAPTKAESEATLLKAIKVAKCMRKHGIHMPDPTLQPNGQLEINMANVNNNDPRFNSVGTFCEQQVYGYS